MKEHADGIQNQKVEEVSIFRSIAAAQRMLGTEKMDQRIEL
jgi:hypothetical protein